MTVEPRLSRGLRDLLPDQMLARQQMVDTIRRVYELYGFVPLSTPAIEFLDVAVPHRLELFTGSDSYAQTARE